jgi:hypothetical protein
MVDEALEVLTGLWSGQPFSYQGTHFQVSEIICLPRPVQQPRIPIWIGGGFPNPGPLRRAARWDGAVLYPAAAPGSATDSEQPLMPSRSPPSGTPSAPTAPAQARSTSSPEDPNAVPIPAAPASWSASPRRQAPPGSANGSRPPTRPPCTPPSLKARYEPTQPERRVKLRGETWAAQGTQGAPRRAHPAPLRPGGAPSRSGGCAARRLPTVAR